MLFRFTDGFWVVKKAEHFIHTDGRYQVDFECVTDGTGSNKPNSFRPSTSGTVPTRNISAEMTLNKTKPTTAKLSAAKAMISQTNAGYKVSPRRWNGA
mgnify:FL=1